MKEDNFTVACGGLGRAFQIGKGAAEGLSGCFRLKRYFLNKLKNASNQRY